MPTHIQIKRPHRRSQTAHRITPPAVIARPVARTITAVPTRINAPVTSASSPGKGFQPDPHQDYGRFLTPEGGVLIIYKDLDQRLRHTVWRLLVWTIATGGEGIYLMQHSPLHSSWINYALLVAVGLLNFLIVAKPVQIYRKIEIRPDCLILEGTDFFWTRLMENGMPAFRPDKEGNQVLCGIYGTRFVEYLTARRFDENDRMPEVITAHLQNAMQQLWTRPQG